MAPSQQQSQNRKKLALALFLAISAASCGRLIADANAMSPAQRAAKLEHVHRAQSLQAVELQTQTILTRLPSHLPGRNRHELRATVRLLVDAAQRYELDPYLVAALVVAESHYNPAAVSPVGALGLMQVLPYVAEDVALRHGIAWRDDRTLFDPAANAAIGAAYLSELLDEFDGDIALALAAYNIGPSLLKQRLKTGWRPNGPYVRKIMHVYRDLSAAAVESAHLRRLAGLS